MGANGLAVAGRGAWVVWLRTILGAVATTLAVRLAALAVFGIPAEFAPLADVSFLNRPRSRASWGQDAPSPRRDGTSGSS